jgi:hypothetical protein
MSDATERPESELDPELQDWLAEARALDREAPSADYAAMLERVEEDIAAAEARPAFWLETRATWARRAMGALSALAVVLLFGVAMTKRDLGALSPLHLGVALGALGVLLAASVHQALRPLHRPPLPAWARIGLGALTLAATFTLALFPVPDAHALSPASGPWVSPCLFYGLLAGLPVYLALRLLDRSAGHAPLLASCAAGLAGNLALQLHCPRSDPQHLMLGHFSVALVFIAGLALLHLLLRPRRR